jgi:DNA-3-methyladenine glycosylase
MRKIESQCGESRRTEKIGDWRADRSFPLLRSFYARSPIEVARDLLGMVLVRHRGRQILAGRIVEAEAYLGAGDAAAHAASGITQRNRVLFGPPGHAYVYFTYGMHYCLNASCMPEGDAGCVLIRALEPLTGIPAMASARGLPQLVSVFANRSRPSPPHPSPPRSSPPRSSPLRRLASGPAMLCHALDITRVRDNGCDLTLPASGLWIGDDGIHVPRTRIVATCRIGIRKSTELPLRFFVRDNPFVSAGRIALRPRG